MELSQVIATGVFTLLGVGMGLFWQIKKTKIDKEEELKDLLRNKAEHLIDEINSLRENNMEAISNLIREAGEYERTGQIPEITKSGNKLSHNKIRGLTFIYFSEISFIIKEYDIKLKELSDTFKTKKVTFEDTYTFGSLLMTETGKLCENLENALLENINGLTK